MEFKLSKNGISGVFVNNTCPICNLGYKSKRIFYFPLKDKNGIPIDKSLRVIENSELHKKLLNSGMDLPMCWIVEE